MYELGIRQAFNKPVVLIKDQRTERVFDIAGFRIFEYDESLRADIVEERMSELAALMQETVAAPATDVNSLIELLGVKPAVLSSTVNLDERETLILNAIRDLGERIDDLSRNPAAIQYIPYGSFGESIYGGLGPTNVFGDALSFAKPVTDYVAPASEPNEHGVADLWNEGRDRDLIGRALFLNGTNIGFIAEVDRLGSRIVFLDRNNLPKSIQRHDPRFGQILVRME